MALSDKVQNMKFMQKTQQKSSGESAEKKTRVLDTSEWSSSSKARNIKVLKAKRQKVRTIGYASISKLSSTDGRKTLGRPLPKSETKTAENDTSSASKPKEEPRTQKTKSLAALWKSKMKDS